MTPGAEIEPGPNWWKASALTTRPTLGRRYIRDDALPSIFPWSVSSPNRKSPRKRQNVVEMPSSCPTMDNLATNENNKGDSQDKEIADLRAQIAALQEENLILQETNKDLKNHLTKN